MKRHMKSVHDYDSDEENVEFENIDVWLKILHSW